MEVCVFRLTSAPFLSTNDAISRAAETQFNMSIVHKKSKHSPKLSGFSCGIKCPAPSMRTFDEFFGRSHTRTWVSSEEPILHKV